MVDQLRSSILRRMDQLGSTSLLYTLNWVPPVSLENRMILPSKPANNPSLVLTIMALAIVVATMEVLKMVLAIMVATMEVLKMVLAIVVAMMEVLMVALAIVVAMMEVLMMALAVVGATMEVVMVVLAVVMITIATTNKMVTLAQTSTKYLQGWETS